MYRGGIQLTELQVLWLVHLLRLLFVILCLCLRQDCRQPSSIPQEPNQNGNQTGVRSHANHGMLYSTYLPRRSSWLRQTLRFSTRRPICSLQRPSIPHLHYLHRLPDLLDSPGSSPPLSLQAPAQASPQVDHAYSIRIPRFPPPRWLRPINPVSPLSIHLSATKIRIRSSIRLHQRVDHLHP